jgi:type I restriction enzyme S subunit
MEVEWAEMPLGEVITLQRGFDWPSQNRKPGKVPIVSSSGISDYHSEVGVKGPGVVTGRYGTIGQVFLIKEDYWPLNTTLWVKDFHGNDPHFASYLLRTVDFQSCSDKSSVPGVNRNDLHRIPVLLPPLAQQKAIAAVLGALDDKIELNRRMNATLESMARALFQSWFVDFDPVRAKLDERQPVGIDSSIAALFPDSFQNSKVGHIPKGWHLGRLSDLCNLKRGHDLPSSSRTAGPIPVISSSGISGSHSETNIRGPGVVTGRYGTIGKVFYVESDYWPLNTTLYVDDFKANPPRFVFHVLGEVSFQDYTDKAAVPGVNRNHLHEEPVVLPPMLLRQAFAHTVSPIWALHTANERESRNLATLRDTLLPKLLSGELRAAAAIETMGLLR